MNLNTTCPLQIYKKHISETFKRKLARPEFFNKMRQAFSGGFEKDSIVCLSSVPKKPLSYFDYESQFMYLEILEEVPLLLHKRMFKVTYKGALLTPTTMVFKCY